MSRPSSSPQEKLLSSLFSFLLFGMLTLLGLGLGAFVIGGLTALIAAAGGGESLVDDYWETLRDNGGSIFGGGALAGGLLAFFFALFNPVAKPPRPQKNSPDAGPTS